MLLGGLITFCIRFSPIYLLAEGRFEIPNNAGMFALFLLKLFLYVPGLGVQTLQTLHSTYTKTVCD